MGAGVGAGVAVGTGVGAGVAPVGADGDGDPEAPPQAETRTARITKGELAEDLIMDTPTKLLRCWPTSSSYGFSP